MAVDKALLQQLVDELPFTKAEDKTYLLNALNADEAAATQFVGQRLRHTDYTKKTTELSQKETSLADKANQSVRTYAQQLAEAQAKIKDISDKYSTAEISRTRAETLLQKVKSVYNLTDDDIPKVEATPTQQQQQAPVIDIDAKLRDFEKSLLEKLSPINSFPQIPVLINEMQYEHMQLTGQRLPEAKIREYMTLASKDGGPSLRQAWEEEHKIPELRKQAERKQWETEYAAKFADEQKKLASEAALRGVTKGPDGRFQSLSPVMRKNFEQHVDPTAQRQTETPPAQGRENGPKPTGAERAAQKFIERREQGIPMGQEAPVGK